MTIQETKLFMERIKQHYQEFVIDNYKITEWYKELKDYDYNEVNVKLDDHLRNEQFGNQIPKVYFLTKYLTKLSEKGQYDASKIKVRCHLCNAILSFEEYDKHIARCNSVEYLNQQSLRFYDKEIDKAKYRNMEDKDFNGIYDKVLYKILEISENEKEKEMISNYFVGRGKQ